MTNDSSRPSLPPFKRSAGPALPPPFERPPSGPPAPPIEGLASGELPLESEVLTRMPPVPPPTVPADGLPWWQRKRFLIPVAFLALVVVSGAISAATETETTSDSALMVSRTLGRGVTDETYGRGISANPGQVYPGRSFLNSNDHETRLGTATAYNDWNVTVLGYEVTAERESIRLTLHTHVYNRSEDTRKVAPAHWSLLNYSSPGEGDTRSVSTGEDRDLAVTFQIPRQSAELIIAHQSDNNDTARGIVMISIDIDDQGKAIAVPWTYQDTSGGATISPATADEPGSATASTTSPDSERIRTWSCSSPGGGNGLAQMPWLDVSQASATLDGRSLRVTIEVGAHPDSAPIGNDPFWALYISPAQNTNIFEANGYQVSAYHYPEGTEFLFFDGETMRATPGAITGGFSGNTLTMSVDRSHMPNLAESVYAFVATEGGLPEFVEDSCGGSDNAMTPMVGGGSDVGVDEVQAAATAVHAIDEAIFERMPDLVCVELQAAQDILQELTGEFFASDSVDASGKDRFQINDSNWIVVDQEPDPGDRMIFDPNLFVLKKDEAKDQGLC